MFRKGRETDALVLREIQGNPGSTIHEIAVKLGFSNGRVDGSVNRLISQGKADVRHHLRRSLLVKKVYPLRYVPKPPNIIELPMNMIEVNLWRDTVYVYALSRSTIAFSPVSVAEWEERALIKEKIAIAKTEDTLQIELPNFLSDFYQLENSETSLSTTARFAIATVESILPVRLPPSYPAEVPFEITRILMVEKIKGTTSHVSEVDVDLLEGETSVTIPYEADLTLMAERIAKEERKLSTESSETTDLMVEVT